MDKTCWEICWFAENVVRTLGGERKEGRLFIVAQQEFRKEERLVKNHQLLRKNV